MKTLSNILAISITALFVFAGCESEDDTQNVNGGGPADNEVWMQNSEFVPQDKTVEIGTTVKWINKDNFAHTVTSPADLFDSGEVGAGETFEYTFDSLGTFDVNCEIHPDMTGTITVESSSSGDNGSNY